MPGSSLFARSPFGSGAAVSFLAAAAIVAVGMWQLDRSRIEVLKHSANEVRILTQALAQHAARTIEAVDLTLENVVERASDSRTSSSDLTTFLRQSVTRLGQLRNLAVVRADGSWRADGHMTQAARSSADRKYFIWHRDHSDPALHVDDLIDSLTTGEVSIPLSRRLNNTDGSFSGLVIATLSPQYLDQLYKQVKDGDRGSVSVWMQDGRLLSRYPAAANSSPEAKASTTLMMAKLFGAGRGISRAVSPLDGVERLFAFERLDGLPLAVSASVSVDDALAGWRHDAWTEGLVIGGSSLLLIVLGIGLEAHRRRILTLLLTAQAADQRYKMLADNTSDVITHMALDGTRLYVSPSSRRFLGLDPEHLVGNNSRVIVHPDDDVHWQSVFDDFAAGLIDHAITLKRLRHRDGTWIWSETSLQLLRDTEGRPSSVVGSSRNVTDRQEIKALRNSEARYRILAETTSDVIVQLDLVRRRQYVSPACRLLLGYRPEELLNLDFLESIHPDDSGKRQELTERLLAGEIAGDRAVTTYRMRHRNGDWIWVEDAVSLVRQSETHAPSSFICSLRDVSAREHMARHLEQAKADAEAAGRAKTDFVANMSHELRTPLTGILGVLDMLGRDINMTMEQRRLVRLAGNAGTSLLSIVNDVLDFSKIEAGQMTIENVSFSVDQLVESCHDFVAEGLKGKPVELRTVAKATAGLWCVGDPTRVRQVLLNLMLNAAKFTDQGHITVASDYDLRRGVLRIDVTDTGVGISPGIADLIFERFSQADTSTTRRFGGTGLGLAICKRLVNLMGGEIGCEALVEGGSNFFFKLPLRTVGEVKAATPVTAFPGFAPTIGRLLLVDDNALIADVISAMLSARGYEVSVLTDGAAAVDELARTSAFDLVLMDVQMPGMDGLAATAAIRAMEAARGDRRLPVIGLTANAMVEDAAFCLASGMDDHVPKPVIWADLFAAIDRHLIHAKLSARAA